MRAELTRPARLVAGDRVAVVSASFAAPGMFPAVHELAMRRLRAEIGLQPVEYPTTGTVGASPQARAADLMAAFADPEIKAILATIGGEDQISVPRWLDPELVAEHPKAFVGYTNILNWCWNLGLAGYHGDSTMVHLGRAGALHPTPAAGGTVPGR
jgi:muramoyltetrapeptide carboxypeptidase LdcA involved in peptidoglycan recycling